jgi:hypothetical protein
LETLYLESHKRLSLERIAQAVSQFWSVDRPNDNRLAVLGPAGRAYIYREEHASTDGDRVFIDYSDVEFVKQVLLVFVNDPNIMIDLDFETVMRGDEFVARAQADKDWDWRREWLPKH